MNILFVILARGGSKRVPGKNIKLLGKIPLIAHTLKKVLTFDSRYNFDHILSTDSLEIKEVAESYGAYCPFLRPSELSKDSIPSLPAVQHAVTYLEVEKSKSYDIIVYVQPTAPFWRHQDLHTCLEAVILSHYASAVPVTLVSTHPFKMKRLLSDGRVLNYIDQGKDEMRAYQLLPLVHRRAGSFYVSKIETVMKDNTLVGDPCFGLEVPPETAIDIDTPIDFAVAEVIYNQQINKV